MTDVLVLNASYEPLRIVPVRRALVLLLQHKAELVEAAEQRLRAQNVAFAVPLVVRLVRYIAIPRNRRLPCSRRGVLTRDRETCQYCGAQPGRAALTLDHVVPRAQGGTTAWENVVAAWRRATTAKPTARPRRLAWRSAASRASRAMSRLRWSARWSSTRSGRSTPTYN